MTADDHATIGPDEAALLELMDALRAQAEHPEGRLAALRARLRSQALERVAAHAMAFEALLARADTWPLHGVFLLTGGVRGPEAFRSFRAWLVSLGGTHFTDALADPDALADALVREEPAAPELLRAFRDAYAHRAGHALPPPTLELFAAPRGEPIPDSELPVRFPRVAAAQR